MIHRIIGLGLVTAALTATSPIALADTIQLSVSPSQPRSNEAVTVTASGITEGNPNDGATTGVFKTSGTCPGTYSSPDNPHAPNLPLEQNLSLAGTQTGPYSVSFTFGSGLGTENILCGYLFEYNEELCAAGYPCSITLASTSISITTRETAAEEAAREQTEHRALLERSPVTFLDVWIVQHPGGSAKNPGHTSIKINTNEYAHITVALSHGQQARYTAPGEGGFNVAWSCHHPGWAYHYTVDALGGSGASLTHSGTFRTVSTVRCAALRKVEAQREAARKQREHREAAERETTEAREAEERKRKEKPSPPGAPCYGEGGVKLFKLERVSCAGAQYTWHNYIHEVDLPNGNVAGATVQGTDAPEQQWVCEPEPGQHFCGALGAASYLARFEFEP